MITELPLKGGRGAGGQGRIRRWPAIFLLGPLALAGCRSGESTIPVYPTEGRLLTAAGKPATGATVTFHPVGRAVPLPYTPHGEVDDEGTFRLTSEATGDGAPEGEYDVTVTWRALTPEGERIGPDRLKGKYADPAKPLRRVVVRAGENRLEPIRIE